ncbi:hypothetical protein B9Z19DRAFT_1130364 [Tuber borchii]|uniref:Uncharacterized protein n=1 Tax=Tuber borchii TaxID=42251 RepID=A0A2T6ZKN4_TUBBO|nr:hypothetical protein B9Z19DRAFT_1130364 [Tuber borchii]
MPRRRGITRRASTNESHSRSSTAGIRKNTRSRRAPQRYGDPSDDEVSQPANAESTTLESQSETIITNQQGSQAHSTPETETLRHNTPRTASVESTSLADLLESPNDIMNQVVHRLQPEGTDRNQNQRANSFPHSPTMPPRNNPRIDTTQQRIRELEDEISQLRCQNQHTRPHSGNATREPGTYHPTLPSTTMAMESAPGIGASVEALFPGVERSTLTQIIENRFKSTNIYCLLASEKERAEIQRTITIGGVEFEQAERDGKESEYRMSALFKAWAAYSGILLKLAPYSLKGDLATAMFIYTMNLYDLLEKYTWDGVKAYHFQFHRKRVTSGNSIYLPSEFQQLDSELIASKCFAHPIIRTLWP